MFTYQTPFIGFTLSMDLSSTFFRTLHDLCVEFDYRSTEDFDLEQLNEIIDEMEHVDQLNPIVINQLNLAKDFVSWIQTQSEAFTFKTGYHGSLDSPVYLEFNDSKTNQKLDKAYHKHDSYVLSNDLLNNVSEDIESLEKFCYQSMSRELFTFFFSQKLFGLNFVSCST